MPESEVACPSRRQLLLKKGAGPEAVLEAAVTAAAVSTGVWPEMR